MQRRNGHGDVPHNDPQWRDVRSMGVGIDNGNGRVSPGDTELAFITFVTRERFGVAPFHEGTGDVDCGHTQEYHEAQGTRFAEEIRNQVAAEVAVVGEPADWTLTQVRNAERWHPGKVAIAAVFTSSMLSIAGKDGRTAYVVMAGMGYPVAGALVGLTMGVPTELNGAPATMEQLVGLTRGRDRLAMLGLAAVTAAHLGLSPRAVRAMDVQWKADHGDGS